MNYRQVFEDALKEDRYNSTVRLIYADWLEGNGFDDEAVEQRRRAKPEWAEADKWMHDFASTCGPSCRNYIELSEEYQARWVGMNYYDPVDRERMDALRKEQRQREDWQPVTYEECIQTGYDYLRWVQMGRDDIRDRMYKPNMATTWWRNWSIITGEKLPEDVEHGEHGSAPFSCTC